MFVVIRSDMFVLFVAKLLWHFLRLEKCLTPQLGKVFLVPASRRGSPSDNIAAGGKDAAVDINARRAAGQNMKDARADSRK
jgi:hypothetical protein